MTTGRSQQPAHRPRRDALHVLAFVAALAATACGNGSDTSPTAPSGSASRDMLSLDLSCPASLLIGERAPCIAVARMRSGQMPVVSFDATWSSARPDLVTVDATGIVSGRSAGQAAISASYGGRQATASVTVTAEDALRVRAAAEQGEFRAGTTVTMWLQGYYSVASAETGRLSLRITDQSGTINATAPMTVARGGDFFLLSTTFVVPQNSTQVCRTAVLEVGPVTVAEPQSNASGWCIPIRP
ncbi:MAG TPA: Ig-like domain-containing protein [Vicinamibacterales bacterium]|nr:Ig-like domain-containing protein [Vicinamibacterales bacterium]